MRNKDFCRLMLEQEKQKRSNGDESTADLYRATRNHFAAFIREGGKSGLLGDVTQDVVQEFVLYLKGKKLRVNSVNSYISNLRAMYNLSLIHILSLLKAGLDIGFWPELKITKLI